MSGGGTNTVQNNSSPPPQFLDAYVNATNRANQVSQTPFSTPVAPVAGFQQGTTQGAVDVNGAEGAAQPFIGAASNLINASQTQLAPSYQPYANQAGAGYEAGAGINLNGVLTPYTNSATNLYDQSAGGVTPQQFSAGQVSQYESPYTQQVVNATQNQFNNQNAQQQQGVIGNAISAGAWGGDRSAVAQGITAGQEQLAQAPVIAGLENQGYSQALGEFNTQQGVGLQAQEANRQLQQGAAAGIAGIGGLQTNAAQQQAQNQFTAAAGQSQIGQTALGAQEAQNWLASQGAFSEANLGNENLNTQLQEANAQLGIGSIQQQQEQAELNAPYQNELAAQAYPFQTSQFLSSSVEGLGSNAGGTSSSTSPGPSTASQVAGVGLTGLGVAGLLNGAGAFGSAGWLTGGAGLLAGLKSGGKVPHRDAGGGVGGSAPGITGIPGIVSIVPPSTGVHGSGPPRPPGSTQQQDPSQMALGGLQQINMLKNLGLFGKQSGPSPSPAGIAPDPSAIEAAQTAGQYGITSGEGQANGMLASAKRGGEITPEPHGDIMAQIRAMADPHNPKDAVFVAHGTPMPNIPPYAAMVHGPHGTLITTNQEKAHQFQSGPMDDAKMARLLDYPQSKSEVARSGIGAVVQGRDAQGNVVHESAATPHMMPQAQHAAAQRAPGGSVHVMGLADAHVRRMAQDGTPKFGLGGIVHAPGVPRPPSLGIAGMGGHPFHPPGLGKFALGGGITAYPQDTNMELQAQQSAADIGQAQAIAQAELSTPQLQGFADGGGVDDSPITISGSDNDSLPTPPIPPAGGPPSIGGIGGSGPPPPPQQPAAQISTSPSSGITSGADKKPPTNGDIWSTLLATGLGILGGTSPNAGVNIGRGALQGLNLASQWKNQEQQRAIQQQGIDQTGKYQTGELAARDKQLAQTGQLTQAQLAQQLALHQDTLAQQRLIAQQHLGIEGMNAAETRRFHDIQAQHEQDTLNLGRYTYQPVTQPDPDDPTKTISGMMKLPTRGDEQPTFIKTDTNPNKGTAGQGGVSGREAIFFNRVTASGNEAATALQNIAELPLNTSTGFFGGRQQGTGLMSAAKESLTNSLTSQSVQDYNTMITGVSRNLSTIEAAGLAPPGSLTHSMDSIALHEGDSPMTQMRKMAEMRQIIEKGLEPNLANKRIPPEQKDIVTNIIKQVQAAVPFTQHDVTTFERQGKTGQTLADYASGNNLGGKPSTMATSQQQQATPSAGQSAAPQAWKYTAAGPNGTVIHSNDGSSWVTPDGKPFGAP